MIAGFFQGTEMPDADWWQALWPDPAGVLTKSGLAAGTTAVDLCAGNGWFTLPMARVARRVIAVDIDGALLDIARRRACEAQLSNCEFIIADAYDLAKVVVEPVDYVFLANAFHGVPDKVRLSKSVADSLAPDGQFAVVNWHQRPREETTVLGQPRGPKTELRMRPDEVKAAVEQSGLKFARLVEIPPYHYSAVFQKVRALAG
jgi:ubiquinone/menaquinone biosynthesis C-methylase UbiE